MTELVDLAIYFAIFLGRKLELKTSKRFKSHRGTEDSRLSTGFSPKTNSHPTMRLLLYPTECNTLEFSEDVAQDESGNKGITLGLHS